MLLRILDFIHREGIVSTQQLTREFHLDPLALEPMLALCLSKGLIQKQQQKTKCKSTCGPCHLPGLSYYSPK